jgi:REDY-like protein HapK
MKCFVLFNLRPGVTPEQYDEWFREVNVPANDTLTTNRNYRVWRVSGVMDGEPTFTYLEEMELDDRAAFEAEIESSEAMSAMLEQWYARVADQVIVFAEEVAQK